MIKIKRRNFIRRGLAVLVSTVLLPPFFLNRVNSFGKEKLSSADFKPTPEQWKEVVSKQSRYALEYIRQRLKRVVSAYDTEIEISTFSFFGIFLIHFFHGSLLKFQSHIF